MKTRPSFLLTKTDTGSALRPASFRVLAAVLLAATAAFHTSTARNAAGVFFFSRPVAISSAARARMSSDLAAVLAVAGVLGLLLRCGEALLCVGGSFHCFGGGLLGGGRDLLHVGGRLSIGIAGDRQRHGQRAELGGFRFGGRKVGLRGAQLGRGPALRPTSALLSPASALCMSFSPVRTSASAWRASTPAA